MQAFANPRQNIDIAWYLLESTSKKINTFKYLFPLKK